MSDAAKKVLAALLELPPEERLWVVDMAFDSLPRPSPGSSEDTLNFFAELDRRRVGFETGKRPPVPASEVFRRLRDKHG